MNTPSLAERRAAYIAGLRALAEVLEARDEVPLPYDGYTSGITLHFLGGTDPRSAMAAVARAIPCTWRKRIMDGKDVSYFELDGELAGLKLTLSALRDSVCERVVTGTREVTKTVKDPEALAKVPEVEITETVEDVRWECRAILAPAKAEDGVPA